MRRVSNGSMGRSGIAFAVTLFLLGTPDAGADTQRRGETGVASFYGKRFQGRETSSGERFDSGSLTAAHPTHPHGTRLRITNVENGKSVEVRVTDRGPTKPNRREGVIIDLSRAAAERLGFVKDGRTKVRIEVVEPAPRTKKSGPR